MYSRKRTYMKEDFMEDVDTFYPVPLYSITKCIVSTIIIFASQLVFAKPFAASAYFYCLSRSDFLVPNSLNLRCPNGGLGVSFKKTDSPKTAEEKIIE